MALKGKSPEQLEKRLKLFVFGEAGVGKTTAALQFPNAYIIDTEKGTENYVATIKKSGSAVFQSNNFDDIREEIRSLLTEKHPYKTLIIDPITQVYNAVQEKWQRIFDKYTEGKNKEIQDYGPRFWGKVKSDFKSLQRMILSLDMNVIITSHQKILYGENMTRLGETYDSIKGEDYVYDLVFQLVKVADKRYAYSKKERAEIGQNKFPERFEWSYENFCKLYGKDAIEREAKPVAMATAEQVERAKKLIEVVKIEDDTVAKWFNKAEVDSWDEMTEEKIVGCIKFMEKKLNDLKAVA